MRFRAELVRAFINTVLLKGDFGALPCQRVFAAFGLFGILEAVLFRGGKLQFPWWHLKCGVNLRKLEAVCIPTPMLVSVRV